MRWHANVRLTHSNAQFEVLVCLLLALCVSFSKNAGARLSHLHIPPSQASVREAGWRGWSFYMREVREESGRIRSQNLRILRLRGAGGADVDVGEVKGLRFPEYVDEDVDVLRSWERRRDEGGDVMQEFRAASVLANVSEALQNRTSARWMPLELQLAASIAEEVVHLSPQVSKQSPWMHMYTTAKRRQAVSWWQRQVLAFTREGREELCCALAEAATCEKRAWARMRSCMGYNGLAAVHVQEWKPRIRNGTAPRKFISDLFGSHNDTQRVLVLQAACGTLCNDTCVAFAEEMDRLVDGINITKERMLGFPGILTVVRKVHSVCSTLFDYWEDDVMKLPVEASQRFLHVELATMGWERLSVLLEMAGCTWNGVGLERSYVSDVGDKKDVGSATFNSGTMLYVWACVQVCLGDVFSERIVGEPFSYPPTSRDRTMNLQYALVRYQAALDVFDRSNFPLLHTRCKLGIAQALSRLKVPNDLSCSISLSTPFNISQAAAMNLQAAVRLLHNISVYLTESDSFVDWAQAKIELALCLDRLRSWGLPVQGGKDVPTGVPSGVGEPALLVQEVMERIITTTDVLPPSTQNFVLSYLQALYIALSSSTTTPQPSMSSPPRDTETSSSSGSTSRENKTNHFSGSSSRENNIVAAKDWIATWLSSLENNMLYRTVVGKARQDGVRQGTSASVSAQVAALLQGFGIDELLCT